MLSPEIETPRTLFDTICSPKATVTDSAAERKDMFIAAHGNRTDEDKTAGTVNPTMAAVGLLIRRTYQLLHV